MPDPLQGRAITRALDSFDENDSQELNNRWHLNLDMPEPTGRVLIVPAMHDRRGVTNRDVRNASLVLQVHKHILEIGGNAGAFVTKNRHGIYGIINWTMLRQLLGDYNCYCLTQEYWPIHHYERGNRLLGYRELGFRDLGNVVRWFTIEDSTALREQELTRRPSDDVPEEEEI